MDASDCTANYGTICTSTGQLINSATWGINGGPANRPQPAGKYVDCNTALGYCWCEGFPSSMCEYCFKEDVENSSSTATQTASSSKSLPAGSTATSLTAITTITTGSGPTPSTAGYTTTIIKGVSHAAAPNLGGIAAAGLAAAFAGLL
jgi:hypothetical protein